MRITTIFIIFSLMFLACQQKRIMASKKINLEQLYGIWNVDYISSDAQKITGTMMGDPQYEFTENGQRIKSYKVPPHKESVEYEIRKDSIHYPETKNGKKLPSVKIIHLTTDTLVLQHEKAEWRLYKD